MRPKSLGKKKVMKVLSFSLKNYLCAFIILFLLAIPLYSNIAISITQKDNDFSIDASFSVEAPIQKVYEVLVDYGNIPNFTSFIVKSKIIA